MVEQGSGLIVEITDGDHAGFRGTLFYDLAKNQVIRLAYAMATELRSKSVTALAVTPGFLRSEAMLDGFGVREENWRDAIPKARGFEESETPCYVGRAVAALAADRNVHAKTAGVYASWTLAKEYGFRDVDGRQPDCAGYVTRSVNEILGSRNPGSWRALLGHDLVHPAPGRPALEGPDGTHRARPGSLTARAHEPLGAWRSLGSQAMATAGLALEASSSPRGERLFAWTIFPLVMFGSPGLAIHLLSSGVSAVLAYAIPGLLGYGLVVAGERLYPHVPDWNRNLRRAG